MFACMSAMLPFSARLPFFPSLLRAALAKLCRLVTERSATKPPGSWKRKGIYFPALSYVTPRHLDRMDLHQVAHNHQGGQSYLVSC